ncbi:hypothetical protein C0Q70_16467 [Pomacea canaliculata]|uniref:Uncharacterized protein n=1 Tax=Pomacea canaliculata TaxID=400727 RepID=A0A2T7NPV6_POMCA|nr:hypothetical protein C0Q70_16467 [Pomacea canaliculata]
MIRQEAARVALPVRLVVFVFPLGIVSFGYLLKWRRRYWLSKIVRILVQNCVKMNQLLYCEGRPILTTAGHVRANNFAVSFGKTAKSVTRQTSVRTEMLTTMSRLFAFSPMLATFQSI